MLLFVAVSFTLSLNYRPGQFSFKTSNLSHFEGKEQSSQQSDVWCLSCNYYDLSVFQQQLVFIGQTNPLIGGYPETINKRDFNDGSLERVNAG